MALLLVAEGGRQYEGLFFLGEFQLNRGFQLIDRIVRFDNSTGADELEREGGKRRVLCGFRLFLRAGVPCRRARAAGFPGVSVRARAPRRPGISIRRLPARRFPVIRPGHFLHRAAPGA